MPECCLSWQVTQLRLLLQLEKTKSAFAFIPEVTISESEIEKAKVPRGDDLTNTVYHFEYARKVMENLPAIKR